MADRGSSRRKTARSCIDGITFSMPVIPMCIRGAEVHSRPFPSFVTITSVPVSATTKLAPLMPRSASMNLSRSATRAAAAIRSMSSS